MPTDPMWCYENYKGENMITIPKDYYNNPSTHKKFIYLMEMFNALNKALEYPYCEGNEDKKRILAKFENELIKNGYL